MALLRIYYFLTDQKFKCTSCQVYMYILCMIYDITFVTCALTDCSDTGPEVAASASLA